MGDDRDRDWEIAKLDRTQSEHSGEVMRTILFAAAGGGIALILHQGGTLHWWRFVAVAWFAFAAALVFWSWDLQKQKASDRYQTFRTGGENKNKEETNRQKYFTRSLYFDRFAGLCIAVGATIELIYRSGAAACE